MMPEYQPLQDNGQLARYIGPRPGRIVVVTMAGGAVFVAVVAYTEWPERIRDWLPPVTRTVWQPVDEKSTSGP